MRLAGEAGEYALSHGGTTDVAVTAEKNFNHSFVSPCFAPECSVLLQFAHVPHILFDKRSVCLSDEHQSNG